MMLLPGGSVHDAGPIPNGGSPLKPRLERVLGRGDLILLFVVAVANLNIVPAIAAAGPITLWLWLLALLLYFWPQGVAVTELSAKWPGEGGVYLWTKNSFGDQHAFLAGWCYWLANVVYLPTVLLSCIGVGVYMFGPGIQALADDQQFTGTGAAVLLLILLLLSIRGESAGKWVNNLGGIGTIVAAVVLCALAALVLRGQGSAITMHDLHPSVHDWRVFAVFGTLCYSLQGLDLASIMGDEIREPRKILPTAIFWGGVISGAVYIGVTFSMLVALPRGQIGMLTGVLQGITIMAQRVGLRVLVAPLAAFEFLAILGTASAWFSGTARLPFVAGIDRYLPASLGRLHPRYHTPYVALTVFAILSALLILMSYVGASVSEAYLTLLSIAVVLQLIPNVYMFAALLKHAYTRQGEKRGRVYALANAVAGILSSTLGICLAFIPAEGNGHIWAYEFKLVLATGTVLGLALILYSKARRSRVLAVADASMNSS